MSIITNIMNSCDVDEQEAKQILYSSIANAAEIYEYDMAEGKSGFCALSDVVDMVRDECGIEADYELSIATRIEDFLSKHPEIHEKAMQIKDEREREEKWFAECREHEAKGEVYAITKACIVPYISGPIPDFTKTDNVGWVKNEMCHHIKSQLYDWITKTEAERLGLIDKKREPSILDEDTDIE